jgi:hypothetical protein
MIVTLLRPSPQVPKPSVRSAIMCFDASSANIKSQSKQMATAMVDITWIFLLTLFQAMNTILWSISYPEVRSLHTKEELEDLIEVALDTILKCRERWPGTAAASQLYSKLAKACLRSYDVGSSHPPSSLSANSPSSLTDANSPSASEHSSATTGSVAHSQKAFHSPPPQFGYVFDQMPEQINYDFSSGPPPQPSFRSNSIFVNPSSMQTDRRFSYFPPDFTQPQTLPNAWNPMPPPGAQSDIPAPPPAPVHVPTSQPQSMQQPMIADPSYFMQSTPYSFGNHAFGDVNYDTNVRQGSLSQQQQIELMQSLETDGLTEIDNFMNLSAGYENSIKL